MDPKTLPQMPEPRWYSVDREGVAMLCQDEADARANAEESAQMYPHRAPYRAMRLGDVAAAYAAARAEGYAAGRAAGMEEAAKVCENETQEYEQYTGQPHNLAYQCADAIRAAKGESATPAAKPGE